MKIGVDLDGTIYEYPEFFREMIVAMAARGHQFFCTSNHSRSKWPEDCERLRKIGIDPGLISPELMYENQPGSIEERRGDKASMSDRVDINFDDGAHKFQQFTNTPVFRPPWPTWIGTDLPRKEQD